MVANRSFQFMAAIPIISFSLSAWEPPGLIWVEEYPAEGIVSTGQIIGVSGGRFMLAGGSYSDESSRAVAFLVDSQGEIIWLEKYTGNLSSESGSFRSVIETQGEGYLFMGFCGDTTGSVDSWLLKTDDTGAVLDRWISGIPGYDMITGGFGNRRGGFTCSGVIGQQMALQGFDSDLNPVWRETYGSTGIYQSWNSVTSSTDGGILVAGHIDYPHSQPAYYLMKTDSLGRYQWAREWTDSLGYGGNLLEARETPDGGCICLGWGYPDYHGTAFRLSPSGEVLWQRAYPGVTGNDLEMVESGGFTVAGWKDDDLWLARMDAEGETLWETTLDGGSGLPERGCRLCETEEGGYAVFGNYHEGSAWFLSCFGTCNGVPWSFDPETIEVKPPFPNPSGGAVHIPLSLGAPADVTITVFDTAGRSVYRHSIGHLSAGDHDLRWEPQESIPPGCYMVRIQSGSNRISVKAVLI